MPPLYTKRKMHEVLKELNLRAVDGRVNDTEAARILTWRAGSEHGIELTYKPNTVRKHSKKLAPVHPLKVNGAINPRVNLYQVEKLFDLDIEPKRTNRGRFTA